MSLFSRYHSTCFGRLALFGLALFALSACGHPTPPEVAGQEPKAPAGPSPNFVHAVTARGLTIVTNVYSGVGQ